ncbi:hypothetical protein LV716_13240 [Flagellimonas sp. HMM57]|uniref:hypothetical protein n=1 Tax=unclassified Flagellimonas TaxID=2644544 RepID=UPI0013D43196|nr:MULTISPECIES: hypothetical protein [unclassified Flagellimonas]UII75217.1 hypothetical protein LV716_13240 [Flagellimonas sp. HMM57]
MAQDIRDLFAKEREKTYTMKKGHEARFLSKMEEELPGNSIEKKSSSIFWLGIAASLTIIFGLGVHFFSASNNIDSDSTPTMVEHVKEDKERNTISLGDLSPDLKKIESYYVTNINIQLSDLDYTGDNKIVVDGYMERLAELDKEYSKLNVELNEIGPNDQTITALVKNLQLRLQLLEKLKTKLNQLKSSKNEQESSNTI